MNLGSFAVEELQHCLTCNATTSADDGFFYTRLREWVISLVVFFSLYSSSHGILYRYSKKKQEYDEEEDRSYVPLILCAISVALSLGAVLLVPTTIISNEIMDKHATSWYLHWLNKDLIFGLWNNIFWGTNISLFILIPFAYFYYEAEGLGGRGIIARFYEAVIVFFLVSIMVGGLVYLLHNCLYREQASEYLLFSYSLISMAGSLLFLACAPLGFTTLTTSSLKVRKPLRLIRKKSNEQETLLLEKNVVLIKLKESTDLPEEERASLQRKLDEFEEKEQDLKDSPSKKSVVFFNFISLVLASTNILLTLYVILRVTLKMLTTILDGHVPAFFMPLALPHIPHTSSFACLLECCVVIYLVVAAFVGFYTLPRISLIISPSVGDTSMRKLVCNTAIVLLIGSSFPVVINILGVSSFDLMGSYQNTDYLRSKYFLVFYQFVFTIAFMMRCKALLARVWEAVTRSFHPPPPLNLSQSLSSEEVPTTLMEPDDRIGDSGGENAALRLRKKMEH